jgi:hypothetical protein
MPRLGLERWVPAAVLKRAPAMSFTPPPPALRAGRLTVLDKLRDTSDYWQRQQYFLDLTRDARRHGLNAYAPQFEEILRDEEDPDLLCWRLAKALGGSVPESLPPALEPYRQRPELAERYAQRESEAVIAELLDWATSQRKPQERRIRLLLGLIRNPSGRIAVTAQARITTPRLDDEPRTATQLHQLRSEMRRSPELFTPDTAALLEWLTDGVTAIADGRYYSDFDQVRRLNGTGLRSLVDRFHDSPLVTWGDELDPQLAARAGVRPGAQLSAERTPASLVPSFVARDSSLLITLAFVWADGRQRPLSEALYLRDSFEYSRSHPSFVIADGIITPVLQEPPAALVERIEGLGGLPVPAPERPQLLGALASQFPHVQAKLGTHTQWHRVQAVAALDLRPDDWMQIRLFARSTPAWVPGEPLAPDDVVFEYTPDQRWIRAPHGQPSRVEAGDAFAGISVSPADPTGQLEVASPVEPVAAVDTAQVWFEAPDPACVNPALDWLVATQAVAGGRARVSGRQPEWADRDTGWWLKLGRRGIEALAAAWDQRPTTMAFFGTGRVRRLLSGELRVMPRLKIKSSGLDWFSVAAEWEAQGIDLTDEDLATLRAATARFVKISSGWVRREAAEVHDAAASVLADLGIEPGAGEQRLSLWQLAGARPESLETLERLGADAETLGAVERLRQEIAAFTGLPRVGNPPGLVADLRPYQSRGVDFLVHTAALGIGTILADDMGLGKTVQALAWLLHLRAQDPDGGPSLVVCPASVVHNWQREAARFTPDLRVLLLTSGKTRHELRGAIPQHDLIVTNYALLRRDVEAWREVDLRAVIFDEAQNIKNPDAAVTKTAHKLRAHHRLALTGTPLENRALDLWSIVDVVSPGYLGPRARFQARFDRLDAPPHARALLAAKLRPMLLRRTKGEVARDLPERTEERIDCELGKEQRQLYLAEVRRSRNLIDQLSGTPGGIVKNKIHILAALTRLRQICCHPALAGGRSDIPSGKFDALFELLEPLLEEGHKVLVFSQFVECLRLLKKEMVARAIPHHMLTGQSKKRAEIVDGFQNDPRASVFLISLKAGGTGLNLTAASYVVLFDPWWNPAVEAQAIDRTHRIGQDRAVIAYRMIARGSIEEKIFELQQRKAALVRDILGEDGFARALTQDDLKYLLEEA